MVLAAGVFVSAWIDNDIEGGDWWGRSLGQLCTLWLAGFAAGLIVRRWQAVALALLPILVAITFGLEDGGPRLDLSYDRVAESVAAMSLICAAFIAAGVAAAAAVQLIRRRGSAPAPG
jgi:hypothetical protein